MIELGVLIKRNCKLFFKDKGMFITSLITPIILLVLYATFLAKVYRDSFASAMPEGFSVPEALINGTVGGQLISSLLAVSCVTVAFCTNLLMVKHSTLALSYFAASAVATLIINFTALTVCLIYLGATGWYLTAAHVLLLILDVTLLVLFGTALSSVINFPLSTNGQGSAVGTIISAGYGFICGAYMPISAFSDGLQRVISFLPGTYGTSLLRNHALAGVYREMSAEGFPTEVVEGIKDSIDCNLYFFGNKVEIGTMYLILVGATILLIGVYILMNRLKQAKK
ncbi:MAG: ABC transporter permease [Clostridiales bacterium]|nr:ABC transporter permease [Clostridiales bacterium]